MPSTKHPPTTISPTPPYPSHSTPTSYWRCWGSHFFSLQIICHYSLAWVSWTPFSFILELVTSLLCTHNTLWIMMLTFELCLWKIPFKSKQKRWMLQMTNTDIPITDGQRWDGQTGTFQHSISPSHPTKYTDAKVPDLQMSFNDKTSSQGTRAVVKWVSMIRLQARAPGQ